MSYKIINSTVKDGNISLKYGDKETAIKNSNKFLQANNITRAIKLSILYKDKITYLNNSLPSKIETDSLITNQENIFIYLCFGDCIPMILYDKNQKIISLTHLGWQSVNLNLHKKVVEYYINNLKSDINDLEVVLGPSIKKDSYILKNPIQLDIPDWKAYLELVEDDYYKVDLNSYVCDSLKALNIKKIVNSEIDTVTNNNYFSHYRSTYIDTDTPEGRFIYGVILNSNSDIN